MKKVLILHQSQAYAGTDVFALNMISGLKENNYDVEIILNSDNKDIVNFHNICNTHVYKHKLLTTYGLSKYKSLMKKIFILGFYPLLVLIHLVILYKQIKDIKPDKILIVNAGIPGGVMVYTGAIVCGLLNIKTIYTIHNDVVYNRYLKYYNYFIEKISSKFHNIIFVSVSNYNIQRIRTRSYFIKNITLVHNGIKCEKKKDYLVSQENKQFNIVFIGNISNQKGIKLLIEAFNSLDDALNCKLYIYGKIVDKELFNYVEEKSDLNDNIELILNEHNKDVIFKDKNLLVLPSTSLESFGQVLIEAMCYGIPVLGSDDLGIKEVIEIDNNTRAGDTFKLGNRESLTNKITNIVRNISLYSNYKANAFPLFEKYFTKDKMIQNYIKLLEGK